MNKFTISEETTHQDLRITSDIVNSFELKVGFVWIIHIMALVAVNISMVPRWSGSSFTEAAFQANPIGSLSVVISLFVISMFIGIYRSVALTAKYQIAIYNETVIKKTK